MWVLELAEHCISRTCTIYVSIHCRTGPFAANSAWSMFLVRGWMHACPILLRIPLVLLRVFMIKAASRHTLISYPGYGPG